jgi:hypothetical protein
MSYSGFVTRIKIRPHPNADKLAIGQCGAFQVVVAKNTPDLSLGVFFAVDGQLSEQFCKEHDLIARKDEQGNKAGGYFSDSRKIRCQKLRGEKSEGLWMPLECLKFTKGDLTVLKEGDPITVVNGIEICRKYNTPATLKAMINKTIKQRKENKCFAKHFETEHFKRESYKIPKGATLYITAKIHGTSQRIGNVLDITEIQLPWYKRFLNKIFPIFETTKSEYVWLNGTRNTILEKKEDPLSGYYGPDPFRFKITNPLKSLLHKNEMIYGEIAGYTESGTLIMGSVPVKDKDLQKIYGSTMKFTYGNEPNNCSFYVYRITMVNEDGVAVDLFDTAMRKRCEQLGINPVPYICDPFVYDGDLESLKIKLNSLLEKQSIIDQKHIEEGICIRWESYPTCKILKLKSFGFLGIEDEQKSDVSFVDKEEIS